MRRHYGRAERACAQQQHLCDASWAGSGLTRSVLSIRTINPIVKFLRQSNSKYRLKSRTTATHEQFCKRHSKWGCRSN